MKSRNPLAAAPRKPATASPKVRPDRSGPSHVEVVTMGREILRGKLEDANARTIAETIARRGGLVHRITIVDDKTRAIASAVREALGRNPNMVITTGGLGPAPDDRTLDGVAEALGLPLTHSPSAQAMVEEAYQRLRDSRVVRSASLNLVRQKMCRIPVGATPVPNARGIAPGVVCRLSGGTTVICLPGQPKETKAVLDAALELIGDRAPKIQTAYREVESPTADESALRPLLERLAGEYRGLWISSRPIGPSRQGQRVIVTLEATGPSSAEANQLVENAVRRLIALASGSK